MIHEKNSRVSLGVKELFHPQDSDWILATIPVCRIDTGLPVPVYPHFRLKWVLK